MSSSIQNVSQEELVELFPHYQQALANEFDFQPGHGSAAGWDQLPPNERNLKIAAARRALMDLASAAQDGHNREYYAKPGEAEWGC